MNCDHCRTEIVAQATGAPYVAKNGSTCTQVGGIHAPKRFRNNDESARFTAAFRASLGIKG